MADDKAKEACQYCPKVLNKRGMARHIRTVHPEHASPARRRRTREEMDADAAAGGSPDTGPAVAPDAVLDPGEAGHPDEASPASEPGRRWWKFGGADADGKRARRARRRESTASLWELVYANAGTGLIATGADVPVGRVLQMQAPWVGDAIDELVRDTMVDTIVQPLARIANKGDTLAAVTGPPLFVYLLERYPDSAPILVPMLKGVLWPMLLEMAKGARRQQEQERELRDTLADVADQLPDELRQIIEDGGNPVEALFLAIFAPAPQPANEGARA